MRCLLFLVITFLLVQRSNGQVATDLINREIMDSFCEDDKPPPIRINICRFGSNAFSPENRRKDSLFRDSVIKEHHRKFYENKLFKPVTSNTLSSSLGFFCRQELKLDKITPMPVRFRLGSLEYVNWLEQKPNAVYNR